MKMENMQLGIEKASMEPCLQAVEESNEPELSSEEYEKDRGWSWVVCGAFSSMYVLVLGYVHVFGLMFVAFQSEFSSSATATASIMAVYAIAYSFMSLLFCNVLVRKFTARQVTLTGGIIVSGGVALGIFTQSIGFLMFTNGFVLGTGAALIFGPAVVNIGIYFERHRSLATAIVTGGSCIGGMILPPFTRFLLDQYGVRGAMLIFGGVLLHVVPAAMLISPQSSRKRHRKCTLYDRHVSVHDSDKQINNVDGTINVIAYPSKCHDKHLNPISPSLCNLQRFVGNTDCDVDSKNKFCKETILPLYQSLPDKLNREGPINYQYMDRDVLDVPTSCKMETDCKPTSPSTSCRMKNIKRNLKNAIDPSLFRNYLFYTFIGFHVCGSAGVMVFTSFLPPIAKQNGLTDVQTVLLVSLHAGVELVCRICTGIIADHGWFKRYRMLGIVFIILGTVCQFVRFYTTFPLMILYVILFTFSGCFFTLHPLIAVDFFGMEKFHTVYGYVQFTHGLVRTAAYPVIGALRDKTGDYGASCHLLGAGFYVAAFLLLVKPLVVKANTQTETYTSRSHL